MALWTSVALLTGAGVALHRERSRQTRLVRSVVINAPPSSVFEVLGNIENIPEWYRRPGRCAEALLSRLSRWGEHIPREWRLDTQGGSANEIKIRWIQNHEFAYTCKNPAGVSYECVFRIATKDRDSVLVWELRYQNRRWVDAALNRAVAIKDVADSMSRSLDTIRRLAETRAAQRNRRPAEVVWAGIRSRAS